MTNSGPETAWPGSMRPLGATPDADGVNFAVFSEVAEAVEVCLVDADGGETRHELPEVTSNVHHGYLPGVGPGQRYGFRVHGAWSPPEALLCNPAKLLVDPYARAITGAIDWGSEVYGHEPGDLDRRDLRDSAPFMPKSVVVDSSFDWGDDCPPRTALHDTIIYETHVRSLTMAHPDVAPALRGTYAGLATEPIIDHLLRLGITAVELMPIHHFLTEHPLADRGLSNHWGYNTLGFFAPHGPYAAAGDQGQQVAEFKSMVKALHQAGLEVILDVVYNHTAEGNHLGPLLSFKGLDNRAYYRRVHHDQRYYVDFSGTGNTLNTVHPQTLQMTMDSLRYWVSEMHVDGFRFDLAPALVRGQHPDRMSAFLHLVRQDPVINRVKLIAEPWDLGEGGYQVGHFPPDWSEWNGRYRDDVRDYWRGADATLPALASRLTGSSDLYEWSGRRPTASINFVTAHDGFTLADLVSYDHKHNVANGEHNRDGESHNRSWNSGAEGPTKAADVIARRRVRRRSIMATLLLSQGVPMMLGGDEIGRTQGGNNNAYAQDNPVSWYDWAAADDEFFEFCRLLISLRKHHPVFRRRRFFEGRPFHDTDRTDIGWYRPDGVEMQTDDWHRSSGALTVCLNGDAIPTTGPKGEPILDDSFLMMFNAGTRATRFAVPWRAGTARWAVEFDTAELDLSAEATAGDLVTIEPWAMRLWRMAT